MTKITFGILMVLFWFLNCQMAVASTFTDALIGGKANADFRLRYENVDQDNALKNADALTLRKAHAYALLQSRGHKLPSLQELHIQAE